MTWLSYAAALSLGLALIAGGFGAFVYSLERRVAAFPTVPGRIIASEVVRRGMHDSNPGKSSPVRQRWVLDARYAYRVDGRDYVGTRLSSRVLMASAEGDTPAPDWLRARAADYPPGREVIVRYRPGQPDDAVIEIDMSASRLLFSIAGGALALAALLAIARRFV
ncbi:DUF3592 domain-containing protein [Sphingomonas jatrophae]|uniref:DUF3592 domain-containing protein n=1 Tax=Sphingomonas jatrophae TaxID=1166337 RepID=UPI0013F4F62C|nr:DUF3592 domain-containing protein [Sphingomonas jatrophae]